MKTTMTTQSNRSPSLRVLHDIQSEAEYLEQHPELNNVFTFHCWKAYPRSALYFDRQGKFCLCYPKYATCKGQWRINRFNDNSSPSCIRRGNKKQYYLGLAHRKGAKFEYAMIHQIIAQMFVNCDNIFANQIDHLDGNAQNNRYDNLEYVTSKENNRRKWYNFYINQGRPVPAKFLPL